MAPNNTLANITENLGSTAGTSGPEGAGQEKSEGIAIAHLVDGIGQIAGFGKMISVILTGKLLEF